MNLQDIFNTVVQHSRKMPCKAQQDNKKCFYINDNDTNRCFVGALMTESEARRAASSNDDVLGLHNAGKLPERFTPFVGRLMTLQSIHDRHPREEWEQRLRVFADERGLEMPA